MYDPFFDLENVYAESIIPLFGSKKDHAKQHNPFFESKNGHAKRYIRYFCRGVLHTPPQGILKRNV